MSGLKMPKLGAKGGKKLGGKTLGGKTLTGDATTGAGPDRRLMYDWSVPRLPSYFVWTAENRAFCTQVAGSDFLQGESSTVVLGGVSGCGKTTFAKALCASEKFKLRFPDGIIWLYVGGLATVEMACVRMLDVITQATVGGANNDANDANNCKLVTLGWGPTRYIEHFASLLHGRALLLVLDDVWDARIVTHLKHLGLPMLITTRNAELGEMLQVQPMQFSGAAPPLSPFINHTLGNLYREDAAELVAAVVGVGPLAPEPVAKLLACCSGLPLELVLLGSLIRIQTEHKRMKPSAAIDLVANQLQRIQLEVNLRHSLGVSSISQTHLRFWRTITLSFSMLSSKHQMRAITMAVLPKGHIESLARLQAMWDCSRSEALSTASKMARLNLLHTVSKQPVVRVLLPDLVADFIQHRAHTAGPQEGKLVKRCISWLSSTETLVELVKPSVPTSVYTYVSLWDAVQESFNPREHLQPVLDAAASEAPVPAELLPALHPAAQTLQVLMMHKEAALVYQACLRSLPQEELSTAASFRALQLHYSLGECLTAQGQNLQAKHAFKNAMKLASKLGGAATMACEICMQELAAALQRDRKLSQALIVQKLAFEMVQTRYGAHHAAIAFAHRDTSRIELALGRLEDAAASAWRAVHVGEAALGRNHMQVAMLLKFLAVTSLQAGKVDDAQMAICRAFTLVQSTFGAKSTCVIRSMNDIAIILNGVGKHKDAGDVLQEARDLAELTEGLRSPLTGTIIANQAVTHLVLGNALKAKNLVASAMEIMECTLGLGSAQEACSLHCLGAALMHLCDWQAAKDTFVRCATIRSLLFGKQSISLAAMLDTYGCMMVTIKRFNHATKYLRLSIAITEDNLAHAALERGDDGEAAPGPGDSDAPLASKGRRLSMTSNDEAESDSDSDSDAETDPIEGGRSSGKVEHTHPDLAKALYLLALVKRQEGNHRKAQKLMARYEQILSLHRGHPSLEWVEHLAAERSLMDNLVAADHAELVADPGIDIQPLPQQLGVPIPP